MVRPISVLSHKRNSKDFDRLNRRAAVLFNDETAQNKACWAGNCVGTERERFGAADDQRRGCDVPVPDLFQVV